MRSSDKNILFSAEILYSFQAILYKVSGQAAQGVSGQAAQPVPITSLKLSMAVWGQKLDGRPSG